MTQMLTNLAMCLQDAADRALLQLTIVHHVVLEGEYLLANDSAGNPVVLVCGMDPLQRPFDTAARDRLRAVATRAQAPLIIICAWRTIVGIHTEALIQRRPPSSWLAGIWEGAKVSTVDDVMQSGKRAVVTEALRGALTAEKNTQTSWLHNILGELVAATHRADPHDLATLLELTNIPMALPPTIPSEQFLIDIVNAYVAEAFRSGTLSFEHIPVLQTTAELRPLFTALLTELVSTADPVHRLQWQPDQLLLWLAAITGQPVPTIDAIDLSLIAGGLDLQTTRRTGSNKRAVQVIESGTSLGRIAKRLSLLNTQADVGILESLQTNAPEMQRTIEHNTLGPLSVLIFFAPIRILRDPSFAAVRRALVEHMDLRWIIFSDPESLTEPGYDTCCIIAGSQEASAPASVTTMVCLRKPLQSVIKSATDINVFDEQRIEALQQFVRYLQPTSRSKVNTEVSVRVANRQTMASAAVGSCGWDELLLPPDVIASILRKVSPALQPLRSLAVVFNGLRTGANDVLIPTIEDIVREDLEAAYWQRTNGLNTTVDNTVITADDDLESIAGITSSDRRLLLLPEDRMQFAETKVLRRIRQAEDEGIAKRASLVQKDSWWHVPVPPSPDLLISKHQGMRWLVALNPTQALITDAAIGVTMNAPNTAEQTALWLNSTMGLFCHLLIRKSDTLADVTVRDAKELLIPDHSVLEQIDGRKYREFMFRPQLSLQEELGCNDSDTVHLDSVKRDRRRLDKFLMEEVFGLTLEEQRWIYRLTLAWRSYSSNLQYLANALAWQITWTQKIQPLSEWYGIRIGQLPSGTTHTTIVPTAITHASFEHGMFSWQITLWQGSKSEDVIECTSEAEAELTCLLINLGKRTIEVPTDRPLLAEILPIARSFSDDIERALDVVAAWLPEDIRLEVLDRIKVVLVTRE